MEEQLEEWGSYCITARLSALQQVCVGSEGAGCHDRGRY